MIFWCPNQLSEPANNELQKLAIWLREKGHMVSQMSKNWNSNKHKCFCVTSARQLGGHPLRCPSFSEAKLTEKLTFWLYRSKLMKKSLKRVFRKSTEGSHAAKHYFVEKYKRVHSECIRHMYPLNSLSQRPHDSPSRSQNFVEVSSCPHVNLKNC